MPLKGNVRLQQLHGSFLHVRVPTRNRVTQYLDTCLPVPELQQIKFLLFKLSGLWNVVMEAQPDGRHTTVKTYLGDIL